MSVRSVNSWGSTPYPSIAGEKSPGERFVVHPGATDEAVTATAPTPDTTADTVDLSSLAEALQKSAAAQSEDSSSTDRSPSSAGLALYQRVSQFGSPTPSPSQMLKTWNNIMGNAADDTGALRALFQNGSPGAESGILDVSV